MTRSYLGYAKYFVSAIVFHEKKMRLLALSISGMILVIRVILHARQKVCTGFMFVTFIHVPQLKN